MSSSIQKSSIPSPLARHGQSTAVNPQSRFKTIQFLGEAPRVLMHKHNQPLKNWKQIFRENGVGSIWDLEIGDHLQLPTN